MSKFKTYKEHYQYLKNKGICTCCKVRKAEKAYVRCRICLYNDKAYKQAKYEIKKGEL